GIDVVTTYVQQYPYTGLPTVVEKTTLGGGQTIWISRTTTKYCDTVEDAGNGPFCTPHSGTVAGPFQTSRFIYPVTVVDESFPPASVGSNPGPAVSTTTTQLRYDQTGNVLKSLVRTASQTGETYEKLTENAYLSDHDIPLRLGKLTQAIVTSRRILPADSDPMQVPHVTEVDSAQVGNFADASIGNSLRSIPAMIKKRVEPNANQQDETTRNTEMHTAYAYDGFGHVVLTKACATDFGECDDRPEHVGPPELPFRITKVSYAPTEFSPPS